MPSGENTVKLNFHEGLRRHNLYPHFQIMDFSISNGNLRCKFCLECSMVGAMTMLAYVNSVSPSCVYFITLHRLHKQTRAESEHLNQNQNQKSCKNTLLLQSFRSITVNFSPFYHQSSDIRTICRELKKKKHRKTIGPDGWAKIIAPIAMVRNGQKHRHRIVSIKNTSASHRYQKLTIVQV